MRSMEDNGRHKMWSKGVGCIHGHVQLRPKKDKHWDEAVEVSGSVPRAPF